MDELLDEMESFDRPSPADRARRRRLIASAGIVGLAFVGIGQLVTGALFEDSATATVSYTTGNVAIQANGSGAATLAAAANLAPGDSVYRPVNVSNTGSLDLRYAITGVTTLETKSLSTVLLYTLYSGVPVAACGAGNVTGGTALVSNVPIGLAATPLVGSNANGADPGDRTLAAATSEPICVVMTLPIATTSTYASASATVQLTFDAEQTKNN